jgi:hypothetical protein
MDDETPFLSQWKPRSRAEHFYPVYWHGHLCVSEKIKTTKIRTKNTKNLKRRQLLQTSDITFRFQTPQLPSWCNCCCPYAREQSLRIQIWTTHAREIPIIIQNKKIVIDCNTAEHMWIKKLFMSPTNLFLKVKITQKASGATKKKLEKNLSFPKLLSRTIRNGCHAVVSRQHVTLGNTYL